MGAMISRSLYLASPLDPIAILADGLKIRPENCFEHQSHSSDYSFFTREENSLFFSSVEGAFQISVDVNLFHVDWPDLEAKLMELSQKGLVVALPDEDSDSPFDYLIYEDGEKQAVQVVEDEQTDRLRVLRSRNP